MKVLLVLSALFIVALAEETHDVHGFRAAHEKCQSDPANRIDDTMLEKMKNNEELERSEQMDRHQLCMAKAMNMMHENGKVDSEGVATHVRHTISDEAQITEITQKCAKDQETPEKTAQHIMKCMDKNHVFHGRRDHDHSHH